MQAAKDTFLKTLAGRLASVNPARIVTLDGASRSAVMAVENETAMPANAVMETFLVKWEGSAHTTPEAELMYLDCKLSYGSEGSDGMLGTDRGRTITSMEVELLQISEPRWAAKCDYSKNPPLALGTNIFWTPPGMSAESDANGLLVRTATMRVFFFPEVV
jgi:hypothetical protein